MSFVMLSIQQSVNRLLNAMTLADPQAYAYALNDDAGMRVWRWDGLLTLRPRWQIVEYLLSEWSAWREPRLETLSVIPGMTRGSAQFRIFAHENDRFVEHNRALFVSFRNERIQWVELYCAEPVPSAHRTEWIAPEGLDDVALGRLFDEYEQIAEPWDVPPPETHVHLSLVGRLRTSPDPHPASNGGGNARWTEADADAQITALVEHYRARNAGFTWHVGPWDTPADLCARLERHGFVLAGEAACMARTRLDRLDDIPQNEHVEIDQVRPEDTDAIERTIQIAARCFRMTAVQEARACAAKKERVQNPKFFASELHFLARLGGVPVAEATLVLRGGVAYLGGASTLPEHRSQGIYATLLRRRLEIAHARGFHAALIHAEPMSRRIVARHGFRELGRYRIYAWMPVIDMEIVRSLVPNE